MDSANTREGRNVVIERLELARSNRDWWILCFERRYLDECKHLEGTWFWTYWVSGGCSKGNANWHLGFCILSSCMKMKQGLWLPSEESEHWSPREQQQNSLQCLCSSVAHNSEPEMEKTLQEYCWADGPRVSVTPHWRDSGELEEEPRSRLHGTLRLSDCLSQMMF